MKNLLLVLTMICFVNTNIRADNNQDIKELIRQLGSEDWQHRANAQQELTEQGKKLIDIYVDLKKNKATGQSLKTIKNKIEQLARALRQVTETQDAEVKMRLNQMRMYFADLTRSRIAFKSHHGLDVSISLVGADGKDEVTLVELKDLKSFFFADSAPAWSPDGTQIAFEINRGEKMAVYVVDAVSQEHTRLTNPRDGKGYFWGCDKPVWSPDGAKIVYESDRDGNFEIYVMDADGKNQTRLTYNEAKDIWPSWGPGDRVLFESWRDGNKEIYIMDADGKNQTRLTHNPGNDEWPRWSPEKTEIAYSSAVRAKRVILQTVSPQDASAADYSSEEDDKYSIWIMERDGKNKKCLTDKKFNNVFPLWSPDGQRIIFSSDRDGNSEVYSMKSDGSNQKNLTHHQANDWCPTWSPDGTKIAFTSDRDGNNEVYIMDADGANLKNITGSQDTDDLWPAWNPLQLEEIAALFRKPKEENE